MDTLVFYAESRPKLIFLVKHYYVDATCLIEPNNFLKTLLYCAFTFGHGLTLACLVLFSVYKGYHAMVAFVFWTCSDYR